MSEGRGGERGLELARVHVEEKGVKVNDGGEERGGG